MTRHITICMLSIVVVLSNVLAAIAAETVYGIHNYRSWSTTIGIGKKATVDGSTVVTHNNDCEGCDIRVVHVPSALWPSGSKRPIYAFNSEYPRYIERSDSGHSIYGLDYTYDEIDRAIYPHWNYTTPMFQIDQVPRTYGYTYGIYGIQNEKQLSIGQSTCGARFESKPAYLYGNHYAKMHISTLTEIALERCDSARCAISTMGELAERHGFYGTGLPNTGDADHDKESVEEKVRKQQSGEGLIIADPTEVWIFHILPDDTGRSAIWVAQRIPDNSVTAIASQFVITEVNLEDKDHFMASSNLFDIAIRHKLYDPRNKRRPFRFNEVYGYPLRTKAHFATRRIWRIFTMVSPSIAPILSPYTDQFATFGFGQDFRARYPVFVTPDRALRVPEDVFKLARDQFENTAFDLSKRVESGPFGDTIRYPVASKAKDPVYGISKLAEDTALDFAKPVSTWLTVYCTISVNRAYLPAAVGAVTWFAPYVTHLSVFVPIYATAVATPSVLRTGTQFKLNFDSNFWVHSVAGNYLARWYRYTIEDIRAFQTELETQMIIETHKFEQKMKAKEGLMVSNIDLFAKEMTVFHEKLGKDVNYEWWDFFYDMAGKYRDSIQVVNPHAESYQDTPATNDMLLQKPYLVMTGYWGIPGTPPPGETKSYATPINIPTLDSIEAYAQYFPDLANTTYPIILDDQLERYFKANAPKPVKKTNELGVDMNVHAGIGGPRTARGRGRNNNHHPQAPSQPAGRHIVFNPPASATTVPNTAVHQVNIEVDENAEGDLPVMQASAPSANSPASVTTAKTAHSTSNTAHNAHNAHNTVNNIKKSAKSNKKEDLFYREMFFILRNLAFGIILGSACTYGVLLWHSKRSSNYQTIV